MLELIFCIFVICIIFAFIMSILGSIFTEIVFFIEEKIEDIKYYFKNR